MGLYEEMEKVADSIVLRAQAKTLGRRRLRTINPANLRFAVPSAPKPSALDAETRNIIYGRIRDLARIYGLGLLIRQETAHCSSRLECLDDEALRDVLKKMERARECIMDGTPIDEAGLLRPVELDC